MSRLPRLTGFFFLLPLLLATSTGCGPSYGKVSGEVKFSGKPIPTGTISFIPKQKGARAVGGTIQNGQYSVPLVPVGDVTITVNVPPPPPPEKPKKPVRKKEKKKEDEPVPTRYGDPKSSGLSMTVMAGEQTNNIDLQP